jgi:hypothetical protein
MKKLVLDAETIAKLLGLTEQVEIYNERGGLVALLTPLGKTPPSHWPFTEEEVAETRKARENGGPTYTLDDIIKKAGLSELDR